MTRGFRRAGWWDAARNNHFTSIAHINKGVHSLASAHGPRVRMLDEGLGTLARTPTLTLALTALLTLAGCTPSPNPHQVRMLDCGARLLRSVTLPEASEAMLEQQLNQSGLSAMRRAAGQLLGRGQQHGQQHGPQHGPQYLPVELMYDLLHLTPAGYRLWADCLAPVLVELLDVQGGEGRSAAPPRRRAFERRQAQAHEPEAVCIGRSCRGGADPGQVDLP